MCRLTQACLQKDPSWNRFCRHCTIDAQPPGVSPDDDRLRLGTRFTFDVHADPSAPVVDGGEQRTGRPTPLEVSVLEAIDEDDGDGDGHDEGGEGREGRRRTGARRKGWRIAWRQRPTWLMPAWMLRAERVQELVAAGATAGEDGAEATEYYCWETFHGVLAPLVKMVAGNMVERGFEAWMQGLKEKAEKGATG